MRLTPPQNTSVLFSAQRLAARTVSDVLEADDEPDIEPEVSQIDRWLGAA